MKHTSFIDTFREAHLFDGNLSWFLNVCLTAINDSIGSSTYLFPIFVVIEIGKFSG